ncbi:hypothetical protein FQZ97_911800 [compost metagenome]
MIHAGIEPTPLSIWNWAIQNGAHESHQEPEDRIYLNLLPRKNAAVTKSGIRLNNLYYFTDDESKNRWFERARIRGISSINVLCDCFSAKHIWIQDASNELIRCTVRKSDAIRAAYRLEEVEDNQAYLSYVPPTVQHATLMANVKKSIEIDEIVDAASKEKARTPTKGSKASNTKGIRQNRADEQNNLRKSKTPPVGVRENVIYLDTHRDNQPSPPKICDEKSKLIDLLKDLEGEEN